MNKEERKEFMFKEVELIQKIISRMASNSFLIKGWMITVVVVTLILKGTVNIPVLTLIPLIGFWGLDAYYLQQERMYRALYDWVVKNRLTSDENLLSMKATEFKGNVQSIPRIMISKTLLFYAIILAVVVVYEATHIIELVSEFIEILTNFSE